MIKMFASISVAGLGDPQALSGGISEAIVTTALGLGIGIGLGLAIGVIGVWSVVRSFRSSSADRGTWHDLLNPPKGRGDFNFWISIGIYVFSTLAYIGLCVWLVPTFPWIFFIHVFKQFECEKPNTVKDEYFRPDIISCYPFNQP